MERSNWGWLFKFITGAALMMALAWGRGVEADIKEAQDKAAKAKEDAAVLRAYAEATQTALDRMEPRLNSVKEKIDQVDARLDYLVKNVKLK